MPYYTTEQQKLMTRLQAVKDMVAYQDLHGEPCPLMLSQLYELKVLTDKLVGLTREAIAATKDRIK